MIKIKLVSLALGLAGAAVTQAQFAPLPLTPDSYNYDIIVEKGATPPPAAASTATLDAGTNNTAFTYYEQGFNVNSPTSGLPPAGSTITAETLTDHSYALAPSYTDKNAILVDLNVTNATYTLTTPKALTGISLLAASGGGTATNTVIIRHADNTSETNEVTVPDWFGGANTAFTLNGRVDAGSRGFDNVDSGNPRLYSVDTPVTGTSPVTSIEVQRVSGGHVAIFAVSGSTGAEFTPLTGTGFTYDMVIEATAEQQPTALNATTATVDAGFANTDYTWYEQGYNKGAPLTGLPAPGQTITNASAADHIYRLAPDYSVNDAILIDSGTPNVAISPATPITASGLSFLGSSGGGAMTINYTLHHVDGTTQDGSFVLPDWFNATPVAYTVNGRVNAATAEFQAVNSNNPRIYGVDIAVNNTGSPITSIDLNYTTGTGHAAILAVSSAAGAIKPIFDAQPDSVNVLQGGTTQLNAYVSGTAPITLRWQVGTNGNFVDLANSGGFSGSGTTNLVLTGATAANAADYRLIAVNSAGSSTGQVARVNIVSTKTDVTTASDAVTAVGGTSPGAEGVANAINDDTSKYLNYGTDGDQNAPFTGPVGLNVTLANGPAVVTGMRIYTANDATERDPIDFKLEGSNDGTTFTTVASGPLALPLTRNASALALDPLALANQEVSFANAAGYSTYRLTFAHVRSDATANSVQIGEVELLGAAGSGSASLSIARNGDGTITITSSGPGTLESTTSLTPPITWTNEGPINGSMTVSNTGTMRFFRVVQ
jgi:hypothetical protein